MKAPLFFLSFLLILASCSQTSTPSKDVTLSGKTTVASWSHDTHDHASHDHSSDHHESDHHEDDAHGPTHAPEASEGLKSASIGEVDLTAVLDKEFTYLDSENHTYAKATLANLLQTYPKTIVYFYPKDGTPNCTIQAIDFSLMLQDFRAHGYNVIGVSKDDLESHKAFADRNELKIALVQDAESDLLKAFGAQGELQTYGNGDDLSDIIRSTYIVDSNGHAEYAFQDVEAKGHARAIYELVTGEVYP